MATKENTAVEGQVLVTADCPFCKGTYSLGKATRPGGETEPMVLHSKPPCARFLKEDEDALDFAEAARKAKEAS